MSQKNVLITGANKSIGFETAHEMGMLDYRVWVGSRDESLGKLAVSRLMADGIDARLVILDVRDIESVRAAAELDLEEDGNLPSEPSRLSGPLTGYISVLSAKHTSKAGPVSHESYPIRFLPTAHSDARQCRSAAESVGPTGPASSSPKAFAGWDE